MTISTQRAAWVLLALCLVALATPALAAGGAQPLPVIGSDKAFWALAQRPANEDVAKVVLLHAPADRAADGLGVAARLTGKLMPHGLAAHGHTLWVIYLDGAIQQITAQPTDTTPSGWQYFGGRVGSLPEGATLKALAATEHGPVALVRLDSRETLAALDGVQAGRAVSEVDPRIARKRVLLGLPPRMHTRDAESSAAPEDNAPTPPPTPPVAVAEDRLIAWDRGTWVVRDLPRGWAQPKQAWVVVLDAAAETPMLIERASGPADDDASLHLHTWAGGAWQSTRLSVPRGEYVTPLAIDQQLVLVQTPSAAAPEVADVLLARPPKTHALGTLPVGARASDAWAVTRLGAKAAVVTGPPLARERVSSGDPSSTRDLELRAVGVDLQGVKSPPLAIRMRKPSPMDRFAQSLMMLQLVSFAVVLVTMFWQRDAGLKPISLGDRWALADLTRRWTAAVVDLVPALGVSALLFDTSLVSMFTHWPGNQYGHTWEAIQPGVFAIGIFVVYTTLSELIFARTLGKFLLHIHITDRDGHRPEAWRLLVRNVFKIFDLVAWLLLLIPVLSPVNQRLGDLLAGTVITQAKKVDENVKKQDDASQP